MQWTPATQPVLVRMDPTQIDQLLLNLCVNARDAIGATGTITIRLDVVVLDETACAGHDGVRPGEHVHLMFQDTGCGMDAHTLAHLFEPFFTTKAQGRGTGLGLATVYGIVRQNHGIITVESDPGRGTIFHAYLPRQSGAADPPPPSESIRQVASAGETILLVDDDPPILRMVQGMLKQLGYHVLCANGPEEALRHAQSMERPVDLLLSDVVMPGMNGFELSHELIDLCPGFKSLFMSGGAPDLLIQQEAWKDGVQMIIKPFTRMQLAKRIREVLDVAPSVDTLTRK